MGLWHGGEGEWESHPGLWHGGRSLTWVSGMGRSPNHVCGMEGGVSPRSLAWGGVRPRSAAWGKFRPVCFKGVGRNPIQVCSMLEVPPSLSNGAGRNPAQVCGMGRGSPIRSLSRGMGRQVLKREVQSRALKDVESNPCL